MHREGPGLPQVPASSWDRDPERAMDARRHAIDLSVLVLVVIPIIAALVAVFGFRALAAESTEAARVANLTARERMLTVRMAWHALQVSAGGEGARADLQSDESEFLPQLRALRALQSEVRRRPSSETAALLQSIDMVKAAYDRLKPALERSSRATPGTPAAESALDEVQGAVARVLAELEQLLGHLKNVEAEHLQSRTSIVELLVLLESLCALLIAAWFWAGVQRTRRRESELRRLAQVARHTSSGLAMADADRRIVWANEACVVLTMWDSGSLCGRLIEEWLADATDAHGAPLALAATRGVRCEARLSRPSGLPAWVDLEIVPVRDAHGAIEHHAITMQDITGRVEVSQALQESDARFRSALEAMQEGLVVQAADATIEICNPAAEQILGLTADQMCGRTSLDPRWRSVHEDGSEFPGDTHPSVVSLRTGECQHGVVMGVHKPDGSLTWISIDTGVIFLLGDPRPAKVVCSFSDITARRAADQTLRKLTRAVEQSPTAVLITDADARLEFVNQAFTRISGYAPAEVLGRDPRLLASGRTPRAVYDAMWSALRGGQEWRGEIINRKKNGSEYHCDISIFPLRGEHGEITHFVSLAEDVTEKHQREEELAAAREVAINAARTKTEFVQNMSHELRTPMNGILGMAELLLQSALSPAQRNDVVTIRRSAEQQLAVLSQLFDFARLGSNDEPIQHAPFALRACLREVADKLATDTAERGLGWALEVSDEVPDTLVGDAGCLRQVLFHLLGNAVKFTERGLIRLCVSNEYTQDAKARLLLCVHDTGVGIPEDRQATIFDAFQQADGSRTRRHGGIGLGLTLASQLVARMGGTIEVASDLGKGTTFACHLPFELAEASALTAESAEALVGLPLLLLDGGGAERTGIAGTLEHWGVQVRIVPGPDAALAEASRARTEGRPFLFAVVDDRGGGFDAFGAAARLADGLGGSPPIVVFATQTQAGDAERCTKMGVAGLLSGSSSDEDLSELLQYLLAHPGKDLVTASTLQACRRQHRVLLVEDNAVNRKVATRLLERSGFQISVAVNGVEALQKIAADTYDLVLMDIQMPEMDGIEATRHLRASEQGTGRHLPVIALTAHTLGSDRDAAREAGMDDLVAKPIRADVLLECMRKHLGTSERRPRQVALLAPPLEEVLDWDEAIERMDGDEVVLLELLQLFVQDSPNMLKRIEDARRGDDLNALERAAHGLKGASATISAFVVAQLAKRVETLAREGHAEEARGATTQLVHEMRRLIAALTALDTRGRRAA